MLTVDDSQTPAATTIRARSIDDAIPWANEILTDGIGGVWWNPGLSDHDDIQIFLLDG